MIKRFIFNSFVLIGILVVFNSAFEIAYAENINELRENASKGSVRELIELGRLSDKEMLDVWSKFLSDSTANEKVRVISAWALGKMKAYDKQEIMKKVLYDAKTPCSIKGEICLSLTRLDKTQTLPVINKILKDTQCRDRLILSAILTGSKEGKDFVFNFLKDEAGKKYVDKELCEILDYFERDIQIFYELAYFFGKFYFEHKDLFADAEKKGEFVRLAEEINCVGIDYFLNLSGNNISEFEIYQKRGIPLKYLIKFPLKPGDKPEIEILRRDNLETSITLSPQTHFPLVIKSDRNMNGKFDRIENYDGTTGLLSKVERDDDENGKPEGIDEYDKETGFLKMTYSDGDGDGKYEIATYYDLLTGKTNKIEEDINGDGKRDRLTHFNVELGITTKIEEDKNNDGKFEFATIFNESGEPVITEEDKDFDGNPEKRIHYSGGVSTYMEEDKNDNGFYENKYTFNEAGSVIKIEYDKNENGKVEETSYHNDQGAIIKGEFDTNEDGKIDSVVEYDPVTGNMTRIEKDNDFDGKFDILQVYDPKTKKLLRTEKLTE